MATGLPRDSAGSIELIGGTGPIMMVCPLDTFVEVFKEDVTFRLMTPESIDPDRLDPNAPFTATPSAQVGSAHPIVARSLLQGIEIMSRTLVSQERKKAATKILHECKELLISCEVVFKRVSNAIQQVELQIGDGLPAGHTINPFPHVENLEADCAAFLITANRTVKTICELPSVFIELARQDNNFDHLGARLVTTIGEDADLTKFILANAPAGKLIVDMRNGHEHPRNSENRTIVNNFRLIPLQGISPPTWHISKDAPIEVRESMHGMISFLLAMVEMLLIHLVMYEPHEMVHTAIVQIPETDINPAMPFNYRADIYLTNPVTPA